MTQSQIKQKIQSDLDFYRQQLLKCCNSFIWNNAPSLTDKEYYQNIDNVLSIDIDYGEITITYISFEKILITELDDVESTYRLCGAIIYMQSLYRTIINTKK